MKGRRAVLSLSLSLSLLLPEPLSLLAPVSGREEQTLHFRSTCKWGLRIWNLAQDSEGKRRSNSCWIKSRNVLVADGSSVLNTL